MNQKNNISNYIYLIVSHVFYWKDIPSAGPYSTIKKALLSNNLMCNSLLIPLSKYEKPIILEKGDYTKYVKVNKIMGKITPLKYLCDILAILFFTATFCVSNKKKVIIAIDPLCAFACILLKPFFKFKLVFYSVDFNENRLSNKLLQVFYNFTDKISSVKSNQVWCVSETLVKQKESYGIKSLYIPNSFTFTGLLFESEKQNKTGNKTVWTGSISTPNQLIDIVRICKEIQSIRPEMEFWFIPANEIENLRSRILEFDLKNTKIFDVSGQNESMSLVAKCDLGIALYDKKYGSTKYIEPIKIWEYMLCGLPYIISGEPALNNESKTENIAYVLNEGNKVSDYDKLTKFIDASNLTKVSSKCLEIAKKYDASKLVLNAVTLIDS